MRWRSSFIVTMHQPLADSLSITGEAPMNCGPEALFRLPDKDRKCWHGGGRFRRWEET